MDTIVGLASLALTLLGFSGLVVALRSRAIKDWVPRERLLLSLLIAGTLGVMFFSLLPPAFDFFGTAAATTWALSSAILGTYLVIVVVLGLRAERALVKKGHTRPQPLAWWLFPLTLATSIVLFFNASGIASVASIGPYYGALLFVLMEASVMFLLLLSFPTDKPGA